jgi:hypothetical protein
MIPTHLNTALLRKESGPMWAVPKSPKLLRAVLLSSLLCSLPVAASTESQHSFRGRTAFCAPLSPRCFNGRQSHGSTGESVSSAAGGSKHLQITHTDCIVSDCSPSIVRGPSLDSPGQVDVGGVSTPRKHLGPTAEEIVAQRRIEAQQRKTEIMSNWR